MPARRVLVLATTLLALGTQVATASAETPMTGAWRHQERVYDTNGVYQYGVNGDADDITLQDDSGNFAGAEYAKGNRIRGVVANGSVRWYEEISNGGSSYNEVFQGTLSDHDNVVSGYAASCVGGTSSGHAIYQSTFVMSLPGATTPVPTPSTGPPGLATANDLCHQPLPPGPDFRHATATAVRCFRGAASTDTATCEATVVDSGSPAETPSSGVNFAVAADKGSLPGGATCQLKASGGAGSPGTCQVTYAPPAGGLAPGADVPIQATYTGDNDHKPSSTDHGTSVGGAAPPPSTTPPVQTPPPGGSPAPPAAGASTIAECERFALLPADLALSAADYAGPPSGYGPDAQTVITCALLASAQVAGGGRWAVESLAASLTQLDFSSRFIHRYPTFVEIGQEWQYVPAQVRPWISSQTTAHTTAVHDPPAASYTKLAVAHPVKVPLIRLSGNAKARATATTLNRWTRAMATSRGLADAFTLTVNRAGGAKAAGKPAWRGRQMRLAISLARRLSAQDAALIPLTTKLVALAKAAPLAKLATPTATLGRLRTQIARHGLTKVQRKQLAHLGYGPAEQQAVVAAAKSTSVKTGSLPATPVKLLSDPELITQLRTFALYFKLWAAGPDAVTAAALPPAAR